MGSIVTWMALEAAKRPSFVVDNTVADVTTAQAAGAFLSVAGLGSLYSFAAADSILILEYGIRLPYCFDLSDPKPTFSMGWARATDGANLSFFLDSFLIPLQNQLINLRGSQQEGAFFQHYSITQPEAGVAGKLAWRLGGTVPRVSMIGVPDILNGTTQYIDCFVKIQHQLAVT